MIETHEILCPSFIECPICQKTKNEINRSRITKLFGIENDIHILTKHFYHLTITLTPTRETYHRFTLDPLKKVGRELINGLSSISSVSNRKFWSLFVQSGIRFYSIIQKNENEFPTFKLHLIFYGDKDNLDVRMNTQLKYRLKKVCKDFEYKLQYLGQYNLETIQNSLEFDILIDYNSIPIMKLGEDILKEIYKIKDQRPIPFGINYNKRSINKLELI